MDTNATSINETSCTIKLNKNILHEELQMDILKLYLKKQMDMGNSEFQSTIMFLNDPDIPQQYKEQYYKINKRNK